MGLHRGSDSGIARFNYTCVLLNAGVLLQSLVVLPGFEFRVRLCSLRKLHFGELGVECRNSPFLAQVENTFELI